jgi:PTS system nitrogen regulatory IIA component
VTPDISKGDHLKMLARISRLLRKPDLRRSLMGAAGSEEMQRIILEEDEEE